ncbi:ATP-binding protein [Sulfitobacter sp. 1A13191]|jgi:two-component system sensor histidine kinase QseC|uniref:ATP-binding protein n=1 Tax=unclassified Sulfitobacter TaxID=196795 RepID=UPI003747703E
MTSIRARLFLILLVSTGAIWFSAAWWIQHSTRVEVERVLDARLAEAAEMVSSLLSDGRVELSNAADAMAALTTRSEAGYSRQLSCQIWSLDGTMVGASRSAPAGRLTQADSGFSETVVDGERWRVFAEVNEELGLRVMVGDRLAVRDRLVSDVIRGLLVPALAVLPFLAGLIWLSVGQGLAPLSRLAKTLSARSADNLEPVQAEPLPLELRPMGAALNTLFERVTTARERERSFSAYAAHELKTPLSGIKTQAQIAAMAPDEDTRRHALEQIEKGVARTDRMVRQLLELAAVDGASDDGGGEIDLREVISDVVASMQRAADAKGVNLHLDLPASLPSVSGDTVLATLALRNVVENAIAASTTGKVVEIRAAVFGNAAQVTVSDEGFGITEADRSRITERFFRGRNAPEGGSGLGLSITQTAMERIGGSVESRSRGSIGEAMTLTFPAKSA